MARSRDVKPATCHPDRKYFAKGMCRNCYMTEHRKRNPDYRAYMREYNAKWRAANPDKMQGYDAARRADPVKIERDKRKQADINYRVKYGMTLDEVEAMLEGQGGKCKICERNLSRVDANVDHCHTTGYVRGILCMSCNTGLGQLGDTAEALEKALAYLRQEPTRYKAN